MKEEIDIIMQIPSATFQMERTFTEASTQALYKYARWLCEILS